MLNILFFMLQIEERKFDVLAFSQLNWKTEILTKKMADMP